MASAGSKAPDESVDENDTAPVIPEKTFMDKVAEHGSQRLEFQQKMYFYGPVVTLFLALAYVGGGVAFRRVWQREGRERGV